MKRWSQTSYKHAVALQTSFLNVRTYVLWFLFASWWAHSQPPTPTHTQPQRSTDAPTHADSSTPPHPSLPHPPPLVSRSVRTYVPPASPRHAHPHPVPSRFLLSSPCPVPQRPPRTLIAFHIRPRPLPMPASSLPASSPSHSPVRPAPPRT